MSLSVRLDLKGLKTAVASYVAAAKIDLSTLTITQNNIVGLVDTIGKIWTIDTSVYDKLPEFDGEALSFGKTVEEWNQDMSLPQDHNVDEDGSRALKDYTPKYRPVSYSITLGRKVFATSIPYGNIERAVHNEGQFVEVVAMITKKLEDSISLWKYECKREVMGKMIDACESAMGSGATTYTANTTALVVGTAYTNGSGKYAVAMLSQNAENKTFDQLLTEGKLVELKLINEVDLPVDTQTGEAFIKAVKEQVEYASDVSEGHSLNGNVLGVEEELGLYFKQGVMPSIEVDTLAGAFHQEQLALGVDSKVIKDFGSTTSTTFAVLLDKRAIRLFEGYNATRSNENGFGDRLNIFRHVEYTGHYSRNAFICVFKPKAN